MLIRDLNIRFHNPARGRAAAELVHVGLFQDRLRGGVRTYRFDLTVNSLLTVGRQRRPTLDLGGHVFTRARRDVPR